MAVAAPARGEYWWADLDPTRGREQAGIRPVLIVSEDAFNRGPAGLVIVVPLTRSLRRMRSRVRVLPPELSEPGDILCDQIRSVSRDRLTRRIGPAQPVTLAAVEERLRVLLGL